MLENIYNSVVNHIGMSTIENSNPVAYGVKRFSEETTKQQKKAVAVLASGTLIVTSLVVKDQAFQVYCDFGVDSFCPENE